MFGCMACSNSADEEPTLIVGQDFTNTSVRVISIDTFTVELSTIKFDSIISSGTERLLLGKYSDQYFGEITAAPYFRVSTTNYFINEDAELDSVGLVLGYDTYFYNDTTTVSNINVHQLVDNLETDDPSFYNTSEIPYNTNPLTSFHYNPEPNRDSIYIPLPFDFGEPIFRDIVETEIENDEEIQKIRKLLRVKYRSSFLKINL